MVRGQLRSSGMPLAICLQSCVGIGALPGSADDGFRSSEPLTGEGEGCALPSTRFSASPSTAVCSNGKITIRSGAPAMESQDSG